MNSDFKIDIPFDTKPPRLKELVNKALIGDVWVRDTPFGPVTDSMIVASKFGLTQCAQEDLPCKRDESIFRLAKIFMGKRCSASSTIRSHWTIL